MKQPNGAFCLAIGILVFADVCYATSNEYPMVSSILNEARTLRISGDVYKADALLTRAQRIAPRSADVYLEIAYLRKAQGDYTGLREVVISVPILLMVPLLALRNCEFYATNSPCYFH